MLDIPHAGANETLGRHVGRPSRPSMAGGLEGRPTTNTRLILSRAQYKSFPDWIIERKKLCRTTRRENRNQLALHAASTLGGTDSISSADSPS